MRGIVVAGVLVAALPGCAGVERSAETDQRQAPESGVAAGGAPAVPADAFSALVVRVVDGDTFLARREGRRVRVRLIGVDSPESVKPDTAAECFGRTAAKRLRALLPAQTRVLASYQGEQRRDRFGRELWDVWLADGTFLQGQLVREGVVRARAYPPHTRYADVLAAMEQRARADGEGLHGGCRQRSSR